MKRLFPLLAGLFALSLASAASCASATPARPDLRVDTLSGGHFDLAAHRGHWVLVNFWATWCRPCIKEMPELSAFVRAHKNVDAIGLAYDQASVGKIRAFLSRRPVSYPVARVDVMNPPKAFAQPMQLPVTYLIAPDGKVAKRFLGPVTQTELEQVIGAK